MARWRSRPERAEGGAWAPGASVAPGEEIDRDGSTSESVAVEEEGTAGPEALRAALVEGEHEWSALSALSGELERRFLEIGQGLEKLVELSGALQSHSEALRAAQAGGDVRRRLLGSVVELLEAPLRRIGSWEAPMRESIAALERAGKQIELLLASRDSIRRALAPLALVRIVFGIETVRLPERVRESFTTLSQELRRLRDELFATFAVRLRILAGNRPAIRDGIVRLRDIIEEQHGAVGRSRAGAERILAAFRGELERDRTRDEGLTAAGRGISECVGGMVVGVQIQDIVSQRLGHVLAALGELRRSFDEACESGERGAVGRRARYIAEVAVLQERQLRGIVAEVSGAGESLRERTAGVLEHVRHLENGGANSAGEEGGRLEELAAVLDDLRERLARTESRMKVLCDRIAPLGCQTLDVTGVMQELADSIWLIGLNAQVKSSRVGQNGVLRALSTETRGVAARTRGLATEVGLAVDGLNAGFVGAVTQLNGVRDQAGVELEALARGGREYQRRLEHTVRETGEHATAMAKLGSEVRAVAEGLAKAADFDAAVSAVAGTVGLGLRRLATAAGELADRHGVAALAAEELDALKAGYTMAAEVTAHEAAKVALGYGTESADAAAAESAVSDPVGEIELWSAPDDGVGVEVGRSEDSTASSMSLRASEEPSEDAALAVSSPAVGGAGELGANVELF